MNRLLPLYESYRFNLFTFALRDAIHIFDILLTHTATDVDIASYEDKISVGLCIRGCYFPYHRFQIRFSYFSLEEYLCVYSCSCGIDTADTAHSIYSKLQECLSK